MNDALDEIFDESGDEEEQDARCGTISLDSLVIYMIFKSFALFCSERCIG